MTVKAHPVTAGRIRLDGRDITALPPASMLL